MHNNSLTHNTDRTFCVHYYDGIRHRLFMSSGNVCTQYTEYSCKPYLTLTQWWCHDRDQRKSCVQPDRTTDPLTRSIYVRPQPKTDRQDAPAAAAADAHDASLMVHICVRLSARFAVECIGDRRRRRRRRQQCLRHVRRTLRFQSRFPRNKGSAQSK